jgi:hypothetical protein
LIGGNAPAADAVEQMIEQTRRQAMTADPRHG